MIIAQSGRQLCIDISFKQLLDLNHPFGLVIYNLLMAHCK